MRAHCLHLLIAEVGATVDAVLVVLTLLLILLVSVSMFWALLWRETSGRRSAALAEWARAAGFHRRLTLGHAPPAPLSRFAASERDVRLLDWYGSKRCAIVRFVVTSDQAMRHEPLADAAPANATPRAYHPRWHVLIWPIETDWPAAGLRPAHRPNALVDLLQLPPQPGAGGNERFMVHAADRALAAKLAKSSLRGLLPADIGLILVGRFLVLDFSARPFDGIEFNRLTAVAEQMIAHLPAH